MGELADDLGEPVELYRARGPVDAGALYDLLWQAGVPARLDDEPTDDNVVRVFVGRPDLEAAQHLLTEFLADPDPNPAPNLPAAPAASPPEEAAPNPPVRAEWGEVAAVLAVGVFPPLFAAMSSLLVSPGPPAGTVRYWHLAETLALAGATGCAAFVTLYLIRRSGEPWERFGLGRVRIWDVPLGIGMLLVALAVGLCTPCLGPSDDSAWYWPVRPRYPSDAFLMVVKYGVAAFSEELITRAYLITRLEVLLRSRGKAVVLAAVAFASYHIYQGPAGAASCFVFGLAYGLVYLRVRRVWPLALGHALYNMLLAIAGDSLP
jgi:membrane protease YdiL (CAAX protease family)